MKQNNQAQKIINDLKKDRRVKVRTYIGHVKGRHINEIINAVGDKWAEVILKRALSILNETK